MVSALILFGFQKTNSVWQIPPFPLAYLKNLPLKIRVLPVFAVFKREFHFILQSGHSVLKIKAIGGV
jgi:hypothetical protein